MRKMLITLLLVMTLALTMAIAISAAEITVVDDGATEITLGDCVIEGLDGVTIPSPTRGFTYVLNTDTKTAKISKWANYADATLGATFCTPSTVTYGGVTYVVNNFDRVVNNTNDGKGQTNKGNFYLKNIYISDNILAIPSYGFNSCRALEYVYVGKNVATLGTYAFTYGGFTGEAFYVDDGTGNFVRSETVDMPVGNIKAFIWKTQKIETIPTYCFHHMDFDINCVFEFAFEKVKTFESNSMSGNGFAFASSHYNNSGFNPEVFDIRNATSIASDAFTNLKLNATTVILRADQVDKLSIDKYSGSGAHQPQTGNNFVIYGGETKETAIKLSGGIWVINAWYWGANIHFDVVFKGYVAAGDVADGMQNKNGYGKDFVDYYFESMETFNYYLDSVKSSTNGATTLARYAIDTKGYFNVCNSDGTSTSYDITYTDGVVALVTVTDTKYIKTCPTHSILVDGYCTASTLCYACDRQISEGIKHEYNTTVTYADFTKGGVKTTGCTHDYCALYANPVVVELGAIFSDFKYSVKENTNEFGLVMTYKVNNEALAEYETVNGHLNFGVMAIAKKRITTTEGESEVITNPLKNDGTTELSNVVVANVSSNTLASVNLIITGSGDAWEEAKGVEFYVLGFAVNGEALQYFQNSSNTSIGELSTITYNDAKEVA